MTATGANADDGRTSRRLKNAEWLTRGALPQLLAVLNRDGEEARVIGGAVRNALLEMPRGDIDVATTALPETVIARVAAPGFKAVPTGIEHGTVTVVVQGQPFEVTTLREDVETFGRKAKVAFGRDWRRDAERRDFTMNALSVGPDGAIFDYVGGLADLDARRVRFIGDPTTRIAEDYLRILRFFRFHAAYGHGMADAAGLAACIAGRDGLDRLSRERVRMELLKLLAAPRAAATLAIMAEAGILVDVLGGVPLVASFADMVAVEAVVGAAPDPIRRLGALNVFVVEDAERLSAAAAAVERRTRPPAMRWARAPGGSIRRMATQAARALLYRLGPERFVDIVLLAWARSVAEAGDASWRELADLPERWTAPRFPLKAADFITRGLAPGPDLGAAMRAAEAAWIAADFVDDAATLSGIVERAVVNVRASK